MHEGPAGSPYDAVLAQFYSRVYARVVRSLRAKHDWPALDSLEQKWKAQLDTLVAGSLPSARPPLKLRPKPFGRGLVVRKPSHPVVKLEEAVPVPLAKLEASPRSPVKAEREDPCKARKAEAVEGAKAELRSPGPDDADGDEDRARKRALSPPGPAKRPNIAQFQVDGAGWSDAESLPSGRGAPGGESGAESEHEAEFADVVPQAAQKAPVFPESDSDSDAALSDVDISDEEFEDEVNANKIIALVSRSSRSSRQWRVSLRNAVVKVHGREYVFPTADGSFRTG